MPGKKHGKDWHSHTAVGSLKAQAAMEYLMTYGWAILVIVIVMAILILINPFSAPHSCRFDQVGFICNNPVVGSNGLLFMSITNANSNSIDIYKVSCTTDKSPSPPAPPDGTETPKNVPRQGTYQINSTPGSEVSCGTSTYSDRVGSTFSGKVWIFYRNEDDFADYPYRVASASLTTTIVQSS